MFESTGAVLKTAIKHFAEYLTSAEINHAVCRYKNGHHVYTQVGKNICLNSAGVLRFETEPQDSSVTYTSSIVRNTHRSRKTILTVNCMPLW